MPMKASFFVVTVPSTVTTLCRPAGPVNRLVQRAFRVRGQRDRVDTSGDRVLHELDLLVTSVSEVGPKRRLRHRVLARFLAPANMLCQNDESVAFTMTSIRRPDALPGPVLKLGPELEVALPTTNPITRASTSAAARNGVENNSRLRAIASASQP